MGKPEAPAPVPEDSMANALRDAMADAWDAGALAMAAGSITRQNLQDVRKQNPYRKLRLSERA